MNQAVLESPPLDTGFVEILDEGDALRLLGLAEGTLLSRFQARNLARALIERSGPSSHVLTPAETVVLRHLACGWSNKETARKLGLSVRTIETHRLNLRRKTQTGRLSDLVALARDLGLGAV